MRATQPKRDGWADFSTADLENVVLLLVARAEANVLDVEEISILWKCGCELHRRRNRKLLGFLAATPDQIVEHEARLLEN
jgi:hypothetical protein